MEQRIHDLEQALAERDEEARRRLAESALLAEAFRRARIRAWYWDKAERLTRYLPAGGKAHDAKDRMAGSAPYSEDRLLQAVHPDDQTLLTEVWARAYNDHAAYDIEYRVVKDDGTIHHQREVGTPDFDEGGRYRGHYGTTQDITAREAAEQAKKRSHALLMAVLNNAPLEVGIKDVYGRYIMHNAEAERVTGLTSDEIAGKTAVEVFDPDVAAAVTAHDREVMETRRVVRREITASLEGREHIFDAIKFPIIGEEGEFIGIGAFAQDVTEKKRAERKLRQSNRMEVVGQLTGGVAHDFNNLLAVIQGNAELLADLVKDHAALTDPILRATARGAELTQRLLAFSRQQPLRPLSIDIGILVSELSRLLTRTLGENIKIETSVAADLWKALADPGQVENALLNLALNARDAMPGGGRLTIECSNGRLDENDVAGHAEVTAGDYVVLAVSDTGTGMSAEVRARAFEPFFTTKGVGAGTGLGLSMVYGFAGQSAGHVTIYSEEGQGTTVRLFLPRADKGTSREAVSRNDEMPRGRGEVVLVIEDDPEVRTLAVQILSGLGYEVIDVVDAAGARKVLAAGGRVDLMLSDVILTGGMSGPEFAEEARAARPDLPIIFMSGYSAEAARRSGFLASDKVLLSKPFRRQELARALREALA